MDKNLKEMLYRKKSGKNEDEAAESMDENGMFWQGRAETSGLCLQEIECLLTRACFTIVRSSLSSQSALFQAGKDFTRLLQMLEQMGVARSLLQQGKQQVIKQEGSQYYAAKCSCSLLYRFDPRTDAALEQLAQSTGFEMELQIQSSALISGKQQADMVRKAIEQAKAIADQSAAAMQGCVLGVEEAKIVCSWQQPFSQTQSGQQNNYGWPFENRICPLEEEPGPLAVILSQENQDKLIEAMAAMTPEGVPAGVLANIIWKIGRPKSRQTESEEPGIIPL